MGSDSMYALERFNKGNIKRDYIDYAENFVDATWLLNEVESLGVKAELLHFKFLDDIKDPVLKYDQLKVVSYISQNRQNFYGLNWIKELSFHHPEITFEIFGMSKADYDLPENVKLFGWQNHSTFIEHLREGAIFLRLTEHDGFPVSVMEAMSYGSKCFTRNQIPGAICVNSINELLQEFENVKSDVINNMHPDFKIIEYIKSKFNKDKIVSNYIDKLESIVKKSTKHD
jgi:hypothetical protein